MKTLWCAKWSGSLAPTTQGLSHFRPILLALSLSGSIV